MLPAGCRGTHAAADHCDDRQIDRQSGDNAKGIEIVCHRVGSDLRCPESGDDTDYKRTAQLKQTAFYTAWNTGYGIFLISTRFARKI